MLLKGTSLCCGNFHLEPTEFSIIPLQADAFKRQIHNSVSFLVIQFAVCCVSGAFLFGTALGSHLGHLAQEGTSGNATLGGGWLLR